MKLSILDPQGSAVCTSSVPGDGRHPPRAVDARHAADRSAGRRASGAVVVGGGGGGGGGGAARPIRHVAAMRRADLALPLAAGIYTAKLTIGGKDYTKPVTVLEDVWLHERSSRTARERSAF